ncbi:MAG TPA: MFS transporter [Thermoanaerobaculia bacterium]|nr:MFS transporter [Thermoanaerobaculia bacterium]
MSDATFPPAPAPRFDPARRKAVTFALILVTSLSSFESTVVTTAMPTIIGDLHGLPLYSWVFSVYLFGSTITMPVYGRLADVHGRRKMLLLAIALFLAGSLLSALARTMPHLIAARGLQGLGAGGLIPLSLTVSGDLYSIEERARIQALFSSVWGVGSLIGPLAGAFLTVTLGWRSIFLLNVPLGLLAAWLVATRMIESLGGRRDPGGGAGVLAILRRRAAAVPYASSTLLGIAIYGVSTFVPLYVQGARGGTAESAGAVVTPLILFWALSSAAGGRLILRVGFRGAALLGAAFLVLGFVGLVAAAALDAPTAFISGACAVVGMGLGPTALSQVLAVQEDAPAERRGVATSLVPFFRTVGGTLGVGAMGAVLAARLAARLGPALGSASRALSGEIPAPPGFRLAMESALLPIFASLLAVSCLSTVAAARFPAGRRRAGRGPSGGDSG